MMWYLTPLSELNSFWHSRQRYLPTECSPCKTEHNAAPHTEPTHPSPPPSQPKQADTSTLKRQKTFSSKAPQVPQLHLLLHMQRVPAVQQPQLCWCCTDTARGHVGSFPHCQQICALLGLSPQLIYVRQAHLIFLLCWRGDAATAGFLSLEPFWG